MPAMAETAPSNISIALLNFASLSSLSSLANSYIFLVGVWRIIKDLTRSALATIPGRRRRALFLVWLKNRRIFSLCFLCLSYNAMIQAAFFFLFKKVKKFGTPADFPRIVGVEDSPPKVPYIEGEIWKSSLRTKLQEGMSSEINFA